ncbi:MAG: LLM class flavin-dependent oxidoreductase [Actinomycetota bacterium]
MVIPNPPHRAERAGRDPSELEVFACLFAAPGPDRASARDAVRRQLMPYLGLPFYRNMLVASGFEEDCDTFDEGMAVQDLPRAFAGISDRMVDEIAATGDIDEVAQTLDTFVKAGCTMPVVGVAGGYEGYEGTGQALAALRSAASLAD